MKGPEWVLRMAQGTAGWAGGVRGDFSVPAPPRNPQWRELNSEPSLDRGSCLSDVQFDFSPCSVSFQISHKKCPGGETSLLITASRTISTQVLWTVCPSIRVGRGGSPSQPAGPSAPRPAESPALGPPHGFSQNPRTASSKDALLGPPRSFLEMDVTAVLLKASLRMNETNE